MYLFLFQINGLFKPIIERKTCILWALLGIFRDLKLTYSDIIINT